MNPLLTILTRAGRIESVHHGRLAVATSDGPLFTAGRADEPAFPRSALKPFQALPLLEDDLDRALGLDLREVTLTCASHGGDERHVEVAASLLKKGGVEAAALLCGKHAPMDDAAARRLYAAGLEPTVLHHNCSGKHAGMLIQARHAKAPLEDYVDPGHPIQVRIRARLAEFAGVAPDSIGVAIDGCSAPAFSLPLVALARAMARFADPRGFAAPIASAARRLFDAAVAEPHFLSGRRRFDHAVMKAGAPRVFCKGGAEGVVALAIRPPQPDLPAIGIAIKADDGNARGCYLPALDLLRWLGFDPPAAADQLSSSLDPIQRNHRGLEVGRLELGEALHGRPASPWADR
jgi:L-asparaginase II